MSLTHKACLIYLEEIRWKGTPICPYCKYQGATPLRNENRYRCNHCCTSYSVTVNTLFHGSHLSMEKWFQAIFLIMSTEDKISIRALASEVSITNTTASTLKQRVRKANKADLEMLKQVSEFYSQKTR